MTTATKTRRKAPEHIPERTLHAVFGALETAGKQLARFAKEADKKVTRWAKKEIRKEKATSSSTRPRTKGG